MTILNKITFTILLTILLPGCIKQPSAFAKSLLNTDRRKLVVLKNDQKINEKVLTLLSNNHDLWNKSHISAVSYNQSLLLIGQTKSNADKERITALISTIPEIKTIYNQIKIKEPLSFKARAKDTWITTQVKTKLLSEPYIGPNRVKVYTEDCVVYLVGALNEQEEKIATSVALSVIGVNNVIKVFDRFTN